ncbi:hypothetical protein ILYODFUR_023295 [Ilyodon furcidens]|uniref:Uncharacterized protein n=1 Tax=Ilyodon furcidens TaxID=33524 RepID=A0ABV0SNP2_9TELE
MCECMSTANNTSRYMHPLFFIQNQKAYVFRKQMQHIFFQVLLVLHLIVMRGNIFVICFQMKFEAKRKAEEERRKREMELTKREVVNVTHLVIPAELGALLQTASGG